MGLHLHRVPLSTEQYFEVIDVASVYIFRSLSLLSVVACSSDKHIPASKPLDKPASSKVVKATKELKTLATGQNVVRRQNSISVKTKKPGLTQAIYTFNSASNNSLKIMNVHSAYKCVGGTVSQAHYFLINGDGKTEISLLDIVSLRPDSDYKITIETDHDCSEFEVSYDLTVWADKTVKPANPEVVRVCDSSHHPQLVVSTQRYPVFATLGGKSFLAADTYCGEKTAQYSNLLCQEKKSDGLESVTCTKFNGTAENETPPTDTGVVVSLHFDTKLGIASISCTLEGAETFVANFSECNDQIQDVKAN